VANVERVVANGSSSEPCKVVQHHADDDDDDDDDDDIAHAEIASHCQQDNARISPHSIDRVVVIFVVVVHSS
jgi:hypothetical protein